MNSAPGKDSRSLYRLFYRFFYISSFLVLIYFLYSGFSFYSTPYGKRPRHEAYRDLRPAGNIGHALAIIGSAMMLFMLFYSVRKRTKIFGKFGKLSDWLDIHIYFGIIGPLLVVLHTSFKVQGLVAVSFWSMIAVALSGVFGRYLYQQIPRDIGGEQLSTLELDKLKNELTEQLTREIQLDKSPLERLEKELSASVHEAYGPVKSLWLLIAGDILNPFKRRKLKAKFKTEFNLPFHLYERVFNIFWERALLNRRIAFLNQVQTLFYYWHVFHKPFAIIMYLVMLIHVTVAVWLGYVWIF